MLNSMDLSMELSIGKFSQNGNKHLLLFMLNSMLLSMELSMKLSITILSMVLSMELRVMVLSLELSNIVSRIFVYTLPKNNYDKNVLFLDQKYPIFVKKYFFMNIKFIMNHIYLNYINY